MLRGTADMYVGMSTLHSEWGDTEVATKFLLRSEGLGEHTGLPQNPYRWRVALARIREAEGDLGSALDLLEEADRLYVGDFSPNVRPVPAYRARVWIAQGRLDDTFAWARGEGLTVDDALSYLREFEHVTLARALLAQHRTERPGRSLQEVIGLLDRLLQTAEEGNRTGTVIEVLVLQALAQQLRGDVPAALVPLAHALELAEPERYVRIFVDEGPPMKVLLDAAVKQHFAPTYVRRLRTDLRTPAKARPGEQGLIDPLSERELDVLRLLGSDLGGPDIARELVVSLNTVRTHTKSIYAKLGVNDRRAAVRRAADLGLFSRRRNRQT